MAVKREADQLVVSVADTGIGIAPEDLESVFAAFEQIDSSYARQQEGTGLGLALPAAWWNCTAARSGWRAPAKTGGAPSPLLSPWGCMPNRRLCRTTAANPHPSRKTSIDGFPGQSAMTP